VAYYYQLPGGGSREGTGYGTAQRNLFENHRFWEASTGENLALLSSHATDTIDYWVHATVPTRDKFAPIGDQSRVSHPDLFDYQEQLVREAVIASRGTPQARRGVWWIANNSVNGMQHGFNFHSDLLATYDAAEAPTALAYHATGVGHFFARSSWATDASWLAFVAGPYDESHAHQDQGSFTLYKRNWLAVTSNVWSHSGIHQETDVHNLVRFVKAGVSIGQSESTTLRSSMTYTTDANGIHVRANLSNAYWRSSSDVRSWTRALDFQGDHLRVHDVCDVAAGVTPVWQLHTPVQPIAQPDGSLLAGNLRITPVTPAAPNVAIVAMSSVDGDIAAGRYRLELRSASGCEFVVDLQGQ
jgi:hypothetical protein